MSERLAPEHHDSLDGIREPAEATAVHGHDGPLAQLAEAYRSGRLHHGLLFSGPAGIGKATAAFRLAHHLIGHPDAAGAPGMIGTADPADPLYRQIASGAHPGVLHLARPFDDKRKVWKTALTVDEVRRVRGFLAQTAHDGGYRVAIVDAADDLNRNAANALLKSLEEPPARTLFILLGHVAGRLLPTIRSRCQVVRFHPLDDAAMEKALLDLGVALPDTPDGRRALFARAGGSVRAAILLAEHGGLEIAEALRQAATDAGRDVAHAHRLADAVAARDAATRFELFNDEALELLAGGARQAAAGGDRARADRLARVWEEARLAVVQAEAYNLDRKQHALTMIARLNDAFRM